MDRAIGIDFGTSTCLVAEGILGQRTSLFPIGTTRAEMPSTVGLTDRAVVVGEDAENLPLSQAARSIKRAITMGLTEIPMDGDPSTSVNADLAITEVLRAIGQRAADRGMTMTDDAVRLSCPASWDGDRRNRLLELAKQAGLPVADHTLIDEPVAAGIAWAIGQTEDHGESIVGKVLVFDMGGGTLDIAHLDVDARPGRDPDITVLSSVGRFEAGDSLDESVAGDLIARYASLGALPRTGHGPATLSAARRAATDAKIALSRGATVSVRFELADRELPTVEYRRQDLEGAFTAQWERATRMMWACLRASTLTYENNRGTIGARRLEPAQLAHDVDHVVLVGGMSQMPMVGKRLRELFPDATVHSKDTIDPIQAVASGLAETSEYGRISFHRPAYDFVLTAPDGAETVMYNTYTPLYTPAQAMSWSDVYYEYSISGQGLPQSGEAVLSIRTADGRAVTIAIGDAASRGIRVELGHAGVRLRIKPNGGILIIDGKGKASRARVKKWPFVRGWDDTLIHLEREERQRDRTPELTYPLSNRYG